MSQEFEDEVTTNEIVPLKRVVVHYDSSKCHSINIMSRGFIHSSQTHVKAFTVYYIPFHCNPCTPSRVLPTSYTCPSVIWNTKNSLSLTHLIYIYILLTYIQYYKTISLKLLHLMAPLLP